jgi:hypothetical protein
MIHLKPFIAAGCLFLSALAAANDSVPALQRIAERETLIRSFFPLPFANPALKPFQYDYRLTEIRLETQRCRESEAIAVQEGNGRQTALIDVESYLPQPNGAVWGNAAYQTGKKYQLKLNESSDAGLLYPYLTGDTIGGDLASEVYRFSGGYARRNSRFAWGVQAAFRATQEYRAIDPRPGNIASDLHFALGGSFFPVPAYALAAAIHLRKYKQKNEIAFYNELGDVKVYHYTGLGTDYARFRTKAGKSYYNGNAAGLSLSLFPRQTKGWIASLKYNRFYFEKVIASLNELDMVNLTEHAIEWETGYRQTGKSQAFAFRFNGRFLRKTGRENVFGDESGNNYPFLVALEQYRSEITFVEAAALYEHYRGNAQWALQPFAGYESQSENYALPRRKTGRTHFTPAVRLSFALNAGKWSFRAAAALKHYFPLNKTLVLTGNVPENFSLPALRRNLDFMAGRRTVAAIDGRLNYAFRQRYALFFALHGQHERYIDNTTLNYITAACGINF